MQNSLTSLSNELAKLVEEYQAEVVAVHARPHFPSSGVRWRPGIVVTADHTVRRDEDIQITLPDGGKVEAKLVGRDAGSDIAVLKAEGIGSPARPADASGNAKVGELALVLGRSPDSGPNASLGIISAFSGPWRTWRGGRLENYIRLDATLFPNSSGGAVIDSQGRILGMATSALSRIAGLAVPTATVNRVVDGLLEKGYLPRGYLGVALQAVAIPDSLRATLALPNQSGVIVVNVEPGGPAEKAGVLLGDILVSVGSTTVEDIDDLQSVSDSSAIGKPVKVKLIRAGAAVEVTAVVDERPGR